MIKNELDNNVGQNDFTDSVQLYYQDLKKFQPISKERERELMIRAKDGDIKARNEIITANLRFVFDIAKKYRGRGVDIADLISEGNKGIIKAIEKFDMKKDVKFFTYAVWWIRQHMMATIESQAKSDTVESKFDDLFQMKNSSINNIGIYDEDGEQIDDEVVCDVEDDEYETKENHEFLVQKKVIVQKLLSKLDKRERLIIMKYFGIENDDDGHCLEEISNEMSLSTERVRQIKLKAINIMRSEVFSLNEAKFLFH